MSQSAKSNSLFPLKMSVKFYLHLLFLCNYVVTYCVAAQLSSKTVFVGRDLSLHCVIPGTPIWLKKSDGQTRMHAIGIGSIKQSSFKDSRFGCHRVLHRSKAGYTAQNAYAYFSPSKITRDHTTDGQTDGRTDGHDLLLRCDGASKNGIRLSKTRKKQPRINHH